jgi:hypothetical protein
VGGADRSQGDRREKVWESIIDPRLESGRLQPIAVDPDGTPSSYRIVSPRQFVLTASFDL